MRLVCISDTHGMHDAVDMTARGRPREVEAFGAWLRARPHTHKVVVAGSHDFLFEREPDAARALVMGEGVHLLRDAGVELEGRRSRGSPWQPWFHDWAFNLPRGEALAEVWARIPAGTDVLVTHGPPLGRLDRVAARDRP